MTEPTSKPAFQPPTDIPALLARVFRPKKAVVTGGMPYANGPVHLGHLAGALVPPDIHARWLGLLIGRENVMFVCGNDDHGSTSEVAALKAGKPIRQFIDEIHEKQSETLRNYSIATDVFSGTSQPECYPIHKELSQNFLRRLYKNKLLEKRRSQQWFDTSMNRFLPDRYVRGQCPNPKCNDLGAYSDTCDVCESQYDPSALINPKSVLSDTTPVMKETVHWWLDMTKVSDSLLTWVKSKEKTWRSNVYLDCIERVLPSLKFSNTFEARYKELKATLPAHKSKYAAGKQVVLQFQSKADLAQTRTLLEAEGFEVHLMDDWAHRSITRDVSWGIPVPPEIDPELNGKTLYVWPDSLIAPIAFTQVALKKQGKNPDDYQKFWCDPEARIYQFLGQDNIFFYTLMQGTLWIGSQADSNRLPIPGEFQLTDIFGAFHLMINGEKMSKTRGNYFTGDQLLGEMGFSSDQVRYFLALLTLNEKPSNFDMNTFVERNKFLAGPLNAALEKPISAVHSKFHGLVPDGKVLESVEKETFKIVQKYLKQMERTDWVTLLFAIENYARQINSLFTQFKPHDDRFPEEQRRDALFSCFYVLKNLMIMLYPFAPVTMGKLRQVLNLPESVWSLNELGKPIPAGHKINEKVPFFPAVEGATTEAT